MRVASVGHAVFAATMVALGVLGLIQGGFAPIWDSVPKGLPARAALAYLCTLVSLACGIALFWRRTAAAAARALFVYLLLWLLAFKARFILTGPLVEGSYQACGETAVLVARLTATDDVSASPSARAACGSQGCSTAWP